MLLKAWAKINWSLDILGRREDGYHLMDMVMQLIELHDDISIEPSDTLSLKVDGRVRVPDTGDNLVLRAAQALRDYAGIQKSAVVVGCGRRAEIWAEEIWNERNSCEKTDSLTDMMIELGF